MPNPDRSNVVDHVVVAILEDRSHDNLVRRLHQPGEVTPDAGPLPMATWLVGGNAELGRGLDRTVPETPDLDGSAGAEGLAIAHANVGLLLSRLRNS